MDENDTAKIARSRFASIKNRKETKTEAERVYTKHGSRMGQRRKTAQKKESVKRRGLTVLDTGRVRLTHVVV